MSKVRAEVEICASYYGDRTSNSGEMEVGIKVRLIGRE
jgi:hypothetical protein